VLEDAAPAVPAHRSSINALEKFKRPFHSRRREIQYTAAIEGAGYDLLDYNVAEASPWGWHDRWSTFFAPVDSNLVICVVDLPPDQHLAVRPGQRSML